MFAGYKVTDMVCSRLRSLPYCYSYRIKTQMVLNVVAEKWLKQNYIADVIEKDEREEKNCK